MCLSALQDNRQGRRIMRLVALFVHFRLTHGSFIQL